MADDPAAFGLTPVAPPGQQPAAAAPVDDPAAFGLEPSTMLPPAARPGMFLSKSETEQLAAGRERALRDLIDRPASWLAHGADYLGITSGQGAAVDIANTEARQQYEQQYGGVAAANMGRTGGQIAATLPIGGALGKVAGAVGDVAAAGADTIAPWLGRAATTVNRLFQGTLSGPQPGFNLPNVAARTAATATSGALQGATAAGLTAGQSDEPIGPQLARGAEIGAVVAPIANAAAEGVGAAKQAFIGGEANPEVQRLATLARDKYSIHLTADQISPSPAIQYIGSQLRQVPGSGMAPAQAALQTQFTKAIGKTIGEDVAQITPPVMERAAQRIGASMDDVAAQTKSIPTDGLVNGLAQVESDAAFLSPLQQPAIKAQLNNVLGTIRQDGTLSGEQYQSLTAFNSPLGRATRSADADVRNAAIDIRHHLDDALEASLPADSPALAQLREARMQYKNLKTIEPLVVKGEPGEISPVALQGRVNQSFKGRGLRSAQPDLAELGDIGRQFNLKPDSGTGTRSAIMAGLGAAGGAAASMFTDPMNALYAAAGGAGAIGAGRIAGSMLRSPEYINRLLQGPVATNPAAGYLTSQAAPAAVVGYQAARRN